MLFTNMRFRALVATAWLCAGVLSAGFAVSQAKATTIVEPPESHHPYQLWADKAKVPTSDFFSIAIKEGKCEAEEFDAEGHLVSITLPGAVACSDGYDEIEMVVENNEDRKTFYHELGHVWDGRMLTDQMRTRFLKLIRQPGLPWWQPPEVEEEEILLAEWWGSEWYADAYAVCAFRNRFPRGTIYVAGNGLIGPPAMRKICHLIRHSRPQGAIYPPAQTGMRVG